MGGHFVSRGRASSSKSSTIQIARLPTYWVDLLRAYRIYIDNQYVGKLCNVVAALGAAFFAWNQYLHLFTIPAPDTRTR